MRVLVVGAGSTGGYFGSRLLQAGRDVTFLVHPGRAKTLRKNGLQIESPHGDANLKPPVIAASEIQTPFDLILLSVKSWSLVEAVEDFAPADPAPAQRDEASGYPDREIWYLKSHWRCV